jgi:5'-3' exonuclease
LIIVDYNHLLNRIVHIAIPQAKPSIKDGYYVTEEYTNFFLHILIKNILYINKTFGSYGEMVLAKDSKISWRKQFYPKYKEHRKKSREKTKINYTEFFAFVNEITKEFEEYFPFKILEVENCEGDDLIAVLAKEFYPKEKILIVSEDKDFKQLLRYDNVEIYRPVLKKFIDKTDLTSWILEHQFMGDIGDNVPKVVDNTEFTQDFITFLKVKGLDISTVYEFEELSISSKLYEEYSEFISESNTKDIVNIENKIFKKMRFGPAAYKKFCENFDANLNSNPMYKKNLERNKVLVMFDYIPDEIQRNILNKFNSLTNTHNTHTILDFLTKHSLLELMTEHQSFNNFSNSVNSTNLEDFLGINKKTTTTNTNNLSQVSVSIDVTDDW